MKNPRKLFSAASLFGIMGLISLGTGFLGLNYLAAERSPTNYLSIFSIGMWIGTAFLLASAILFIIASMQGEKNT